LGFAARPEVLNFPPMTLAEILSDEALRQREFPVTREKIFLAHGGVCPLPQRVEELNWRCKSDGERIQMARRLRTETTMPWNWIARRLAVGTAGYAADCLRGT
jgi:hypothetical protein